MRRSPDECWVWRTGSNPRTYVSFWWGEVHGRAHVFSFLLHHGTLAAGYEVCHTCDNRRCVNPKHLFAGTRAENLADMARKGRAAAPEQKHCNKLSPDNVQAIRLGLSRKEPQRDLAARYGVSQSVISNIKTGAMWRRLVAA